MTTSVAIHDIFIFIGNRIFTKLKICFVYYCVVSSKLAIVRKENVQFFQYNLMCATDIYCRYTLEWHQTENHQTVSPYNFGMFQLTSPSLIVANRSSNKNCIF